MEAKKNFRTITPQSSFLFQLQVCSNNNLLPVYFCHTFMEWKSVQFFKSIDDKETGHSSQERSSVPKKNPSSKNQNCLQY
jgi:hypothetical protein